VRLDRAAFCAAVQVSLHRILGLEMAKREVIWAALINAIGAVLVALIGRWH
jgi:hypothetical protein